MPPIPALPALPPSLDANVAVIANASLPADARFGDALLALLAPESAPTLSMDDAKALGWRGLTLALTPGGLERLPALEEGLEEETETAEGAATTPDLFAMLGLPGLVVPVSTAEAAPVFDLGGDDAMTLVTRDGPALEFATAPVVERESAPVEFAEVQQAAMAVQDAPRVAEAAKLAIDAPVGSSEFRHQTADAMRWMVHNQETHAEIRIEPPDLGPIQIELKIAREGTEVVFVAAHPDTRDALQDQLPELRDLLAESGIRLTDASVRDEPGSQGFAEPQETVFAEVSSNDPLLPIRRAPLGLIDTFA